MIYLFAPYRLDTEKGELSMGGAPVSIEPQVLALLQVLIENRERLVSKDELIEKIWGGRVVSEAAISSRIKSARRAIGDDGEAQRLIRTAPKLGFRFVGAVAVDEPRAAIAPQAAIESDRPRSTRPSIAVLPFSLAGDAGPYAAIADAMPHDIIVELSRLRWLFVISRRSSFQFRAPEIDMQRIRSTLDVRYVLSGAIEAAGDRINVTVELTDAGEGAVLWGESFRGEMGAVHEIRADIVHAIVNALELQIPAHEAKRALKTPQNLDAWALYHLGLHHMYQFSRAGNERAANYFEQAIGKEPDFARAYAGLSFTHFENAFLRVADDPPAAAALARKFAEKSIECDPLDSFCSLVMGRVSWLEADLDAALPWLDRAIELNTNSAQAKYSRAFTETLLGDGRNGRGNADAAIELSPLDPLLYGMLGVKALSYMVTGEPELAVLWAERAVHSPRAHPLIDMITAVAHGLNGDDVKAAAWAQSARRRNPRLTSSDFLNAFPFRDAALRDRVLGILQRV